jgi:Protein of unknown function (DUF3352)
VAKDERGKTVSQFGQGPGMPGQQGGTGSSLPGHGDPWPGHGALFAAAPAAEILSSDGGTVQPGSRRRRTSLVAGVIAFAVLAAGGAGYAAFSALNGGGSQPEDVLPASTIAFLKVDLDPSAGQKLELFSLLQKFPQAAQLQGSDATFGDWLVRRLVESGSGAISYATDVKPWLGKRFAVAVLPGASGAGSVDAVLALQETDDKAAAAALDKIKKVSSSHAFDYAFANGYVVVSPDSSDAAHRAVTAGALAPLTSNRQFVADVASLNSDQVVTGWADATKLGQLVKARLATAAGSGALGALGVAGSGVGGLTSLVGNAYQGRYVMGVHAADGSIEIQVESLGGKPEAALPGVRGIDHVAARAVGVVAIGGLGSRIQAQWQQLSAISLYGGLFAQLHRSTGLTLPGDLETLLGSELDISVGADLARSPAIVAASTSKDPAAAKAVLDKLLHGTRAPVGSIGERIAGPVFYVGNSQAAVAAAGSGHAITANPLYSQAVGDATGAQLVGFVDLTKVWAAMGASTLHTPSQLEAEHLAAVGFTERAGGDTSSFTVRLVIR